MESIFHPPTASDAVCNKDINEDYASEPYKDPFDLFDDVKWDYADMKKKVAKYGLKPCKVSRKMDLIALIADNSLLCN